MQILKSNTDYAVRALIYLAKNRDRYISSREISLAKEIPLSFSRNILQELARQGIVEAKEGINGGLKLLKDSADVYLIDLIEMFQGPIVFSDCLIEKSLCSNAKGCPLREVLNGFEQRLINDIKTITLKKLISEQKNEKTNNKN